MEYLILGFIAGAASIILERWLTSTRLTSEQRGLARQVRD